MSRLAWGILGTANIAIKRVIPAIAAGSRGVVHGIASRDGARAAAVARDLGIAQSYDSYEAMLADPAIEAVYIPLPNHLHVPWAIKALEAGKHVLCEKPIALNAPEAEALIEARDRSGRQLIEAFMVRHHPQWHRARALLRDGAIGTAAAIQASFVFKVTDPANVRNQPDIGGGALYDVGCYTLLAGRYFFEAEPERVIALIDRDPALGVDRLTSGVLGFPGGRQLVFTCALQLAPHQRVTILGSDGRLELAIPFTPGNNIGGRLIIDSGKALDGSSARIEDLPPADQFALQCDNAVAVFRGETTPEFPIEDAIATMRVIDALYRSGRSGGWEAL
jgi:predicted dehydrogenase